MTGLGLSDKNETLQPPAGYFLHAVDAQGAYLRVEYRVTTAVQEGTVVIYLNEMGREVLRTRQVIAAPKNIKPVVVLTRWMKFKNGFFMMLIGIEEMFTCRRK